MKGHDLIIRTYNNAAFLMNRENWDSIFFEGTMSQKVSEILEDKEIVLPKDPNKKKDFLLLKKSILDFLEDGKSGNVTKTDDDSNLSMINLCRYAKEEWQIINASIELLSKCNQRCIHCYWEDLNKGGLELKQLMSLADDLKEIGVIFILLTGGETFLRPDIIEILSYLDELKFALEIKTNGLLLNKGIIDFLSKIKIYDIQVSIYEIQDGYSPFTRSNYNFSQLSENVNLLLLAGVRTSLSVTVGNNNINEIEIWHEKLKSLFGEQIEIFYSPYITPNRGGAGEEVKLRLSRKDLINKFYPFLEKIDGFPKIDKYRDCSINDTVCYAGKDQIAIDPDGFIYPCLDLRIKMGNIKEELLSKILNKRANILDKFSIKKIPKCMSCSLRDFCDSCVGIALIENNDYRRPVEHKCDITYLYNQRRITYEKNLQTT